MVTRRDEGRATALTLRQNKIISNEVESSQQLTTHTTKGCQYYRLEPSAIEILGGVRSELSIFGLLHNGCKIRNGRRGRARGEGDLVKVAMGLGKYTYSTHVHVNLGDDSFGSEGTNERKISLATVHSITSPLITEESLGTLDAPAFVLLEFNL